MENTNNISISKTFESIDKKHQIEISIIDNIGWFCICKLDYENCKTFLILLKQVMEYLNLKNIKYIKQYIYEEDLKYFEKSSHLDIGNGQYVVSTEIIYFLSELTNVLGIYKL
jgi:hypothetical protein